LRFGNVLDGGEMATRKRKPRQRSPSDTACEPGIEPAGSAAEPNEDGLERLRSAADRELEKKGHQIAEAIGKKAAEGDLNSAKFLLAVLEKKSGKGARKKRSGPGAVEKLLLEPVWEEPLKDEGENGGDGAESPEGTATTR
jgi:hypothetical protein